MVKHLLRWWRWRWPLRYHRTSQVMQLAAAIDDVAVEDIRIVVVVIVGATTADR